MRSMADVTLLMGLIIYLPLPWSAARVNEGIITLITLSLHGIVAKCA